MERWFWKNNETHTTLQTQPEVLLRLQSSPHLPSTESQTYTQPTQVGLRNKEMENQSPDNSASSLLLHPTPISKIGLISECQGLCYSVPERNQLLGGGPSPGLQEALKLPAQAVGLALGKCGSWDTQEEIPLNREHLHPKRGPLRLLRTLLPPKTGFFHF